MSYHPNLQIVPKKGSARKICFVIQNEKQKTKKCGEVILKLISEKINDLLSSASSIGVFDKFIRVTCHINRKHLLETYLTETKPM